MNNSYFAVSAFEWAQFTETQFLAGARFQNATFKDAAFFDECKFGTTAGPDEAIFIGVKAARAFYLTKGSFSKVRFLSARLACPNST
jgi:hypothetical protein